MNTSTEAPLAGRVALVTGASRGLGAAIARRFAAEGAQLVLLARTVGGLEELDDAIRADGGLRPLLVPHDLRNFDGLDHLGASLHERYGRLDVLVANAGHLTNLSPVGHILPKVWMETLDINLTANYRLLRSLDPLLRLSDAGRAIFVTCPEADKREAYWGSYAIAKAGLECLVQVYAAELNQTNVCANLVCPGPLRTALRARAFPGEDSQQLPEPDSVTDSFLELALPSCRKNGQKIITG